MGKRYGLIGKNIDYSFSRSYFSKKFRELGLDDHSYENFDLQEIGEASQVLNSKEDIQGLNVTIPYKQSIMPLLDEIDHEALAIGAVNTLKPEGDSWVGHNTDHYGFDKALQPHLTPAHKEALILGTGGASKAVAYALEKRSIPYRFVSRTATGDHLTYEELTSQITERYKLIINTTPLGTHPDIENKPLIPYQGIGREHLLFDLIYNPEETAFMKEGLRRNAKAINGYEMLVAQAEKAWEIWNS